MKKYMMITSPTATVVAIVPLVLLVALGFLSAGSIVGVVLSLIIGVALIIFLLIGSTRGTYITINNGFLRNTFLFMNRGEIPLSSIVSLSTQHPLLLSGKITRVWNTYRDDKGTLVTKTLANRQALSKSDFRDLIERIREANPGVKISEELLK